MVLWARPECDENERAVVRRLALALALARARKAARDTVMRARMIELSWSGLRVPEIAVELDCSQRTVRCWLHRFNRSGLQGLDDLGGQGRKRRITEEERPRIICLVKTVSPGRVRWEPVGELWAFDESVPAEWTLDSLAAAARAEGIEVGRDGGLADSGPPGDASKVGRWYPTSLRRSFVARSTAS
ncbi:transposase [Streptomyces sp. NPDC059378]|uniref:helix-turn-helix domain-containing protein n=1 Tax=Streptomyces sp. NPDC059378 TaxID=3346815 RepID=UPI0036C02D56